MPQEYDAVTGNALEQQAARADPVAPVSYRAGISTADGATKPLVGSGLWLANPGFRTKATVMVETTGNPSACSLRPYRRVGGGSGHVATQSALTLAGAPNYDLAFDVTVDGDDLAVLVESLSGGSSPTVSIYVAWR